VAGDYLREAYYLYVRWGALVKVKQLQDRLPKSAGLVSLNTSAMSAGAPPQQPPLGSASTSFISPCDAFTSTVMPSGDYLDLMSVVKSAQAMLSEIQQEKLLVKLMSGIMENTGANRCVLLLKRDRKLVVEAMGELNSSSTDPPITISLDLNLPPRQAELPITVINFVETTNEMILLDDIPKRGPFASDPYIQRARPRSLLSLPIMHLSEMLGILYLENSSTSSVFNKSRMWLISVISSQVLSLAVMLAVTSCVG
jgi:GAF domain-containing protein